jgi:hypothetical protein
MIEIEIKKSMADYRNNRNKASQRNRDLYPNRHPKQFYFLVLPEMVEKVQQELEPHAGLMTVRGDVDIYVIKPAPVNRLSQRLSLREAVHLAHLMSNHLMAEMELTARLKSRSHGWWWDDDFSI